MYNALGVRFTTDCGGCQIFLVTWNSRNCTKIKMGRFSSINSFLLYFFVHSVIIVIRLSSLCVFFFVLIFTWILVVISLVRFECTRTRSPRTFCRTPQLSWIRTSRFLYQPSKNLAKDKTIQPVFVKKLFFKKKLTFFKILQLKKQLSIFSLIWSRIFLKSSPLRAYLLFLRMVGWCT